VSVLARCALSGKPGAVAIIHLSFESDSDILERLSMGQIGEHYDRGIAFKAEGRYDEAIAEFKAILELDPSHSEAYRQLGLVYGFVGMFDESLESLTKAVELDSGNIGARNDLALTYAMLGMCDEAKAEFQAVLAVDPANDVARKNLVYFS